VVYPPVAQGLTKDDEHRTYTRHWVCALSLLSLRARTAHLETDEFSVCNNWGDFEHTVCTIR